MPPIQPVRGTHDLIGDAMRRHRHVVETASRIAARYGFDEWQTPLLEHVEVFRRSIGDATDVVSKEMYEFADRGGDLLALRPEGTAGVCRALVSNGLTQTLPQRVFYAGPLFRYERPQKGRQRQFHQIGVELIGPPEPLADAEVIALGRDVLAALGLADRVRIELNTLGDAASRDEWRRALVAYFGAHRSSLSPDSLDRLERSPLRILDSKDARDRALADDAPRMEDHLNEASRAHWDGVRRHLDTLGVPFRENNAIVRGLDYYSHTAFEFVTDALGAQGTVLAGGRYDGLVEALGGPATPAVGWAGGIERLAMLLAEAPPAPQMVAVVPLADGDGDDAIRLTATLRRAGVRAELGFRGNARRRLERADKNGAPIAVLVGGEAAARGAVTLKRLGTGEQEDVLSADLPARVASMLAGSEVPAALTDATASG